MDNQDQIQDENQNNDEVTSKQDAIRQEEARQYHEKQARKKNKKLGSSKNEWYEIVPGTKKVVKRFKTKKGVHSVYAGTLDECKHLEIKNFKRK